MQKTRLEAFSDGVLAIIITIMVLELKVPHGTEWKELRPLIPVFISYILSFVYVGIYWGNHHHLLHATHRINSRVMLANMHLLFWLSLIPFTTAWMGENNFGENAVALYAVNALGAGFAYFIFQKTVERSWNNDLGPMREALQKHSKKGITSQILYALAIPAAYIHPIISGLIFVGVSILWIIPDKDIEKAIG